ncbi:OspG family effector kinase, partial [Vibrio parahaemolyticus]
IKECNLKITDSRTTMINSYRENNNLPITQRIKSIKNVVGRNLIFIPKPDYDRPVKNVRFSDHVEVRYIPKIDRNTDFSLGEKIGYGGDFADRNLIFIPKPDYGRPVKNVRFSDHVEVRYIPKTDRDTGFSLGEKIGSGGAANVYVNKLNPKEVIKIFNDKVPYKEVKHEVDCFCKCHGQGSASIIMSDNLPIGIAMKKIIGIPLNAMKYIPEKAKGKFEAMIEDMEVKGILHGDLTETNVLYNEKENEFEFVDITSYSKEYNMLKNSSEKFKLLESYALSRIYIINYVNSKIHQSGISKS